MANNTRGNPSGVTKTNNLIHSDEESFIVNERIIEKYNQAISDGIKVLKKNEVEMSKYMDNLSKNVRKHYEDMDKLEIEFNKNHEKLENEKLRIKKEIANKKGALKRSKYKESIENNKKELELLKNQEEYLIHKEQVLNEERKNLDLKHKKGEFELKNKLKNDILNDKFSSAKVSTGKYFHNNNFRTEKNNYLDNQLKFLQDSDEARQNGASNRDIKKQWIDMQIEHNKKMREAFKDDFRENHKTLASISDKTEKLIDKQSDTFKSVLGPLNIITAPLEEFFGGSIFGALKGVIKGLGEKTMRLGLHFKKVPTTSDMVKLGAEGAGALYVVNKLNGDNKENTNSKLLTILDKLKSSNFISTLSKGLSTIGIFLKKIIGSKLFSIASITGGLALGTKDGIGAMKQNWNDGGKGSSNVSKFIGGFFGGNQKGMQGNTLMEKLGSGFKGAFSNMGKWALVGFGIGNLVTPVIGGLIGGGIGALFGGILGFIGGERIAKFAGVVGNFVKDLTLKGIDKLKIGIEKTKNFGKKIINNNSFLKAYTSSMGNLLKNSINSISEGFTNLKNIINNDDMSFGEKIKLIGSNVINGISNYITGGFKWDKESGIIDNVKNLIKSIFTNIKNNIEDFFKNDPLGEWMNTHLISPITNAFSKIGYFFKFIGDTFDWKDPIGSTINLVKGFKEDKKTGTSIFSEYVKSQTTSVNDAIITNNGQVIKTSPKDTLVALKNIPYSMEQARIDSKKSVDSAFNGISDSGNLEQKLDNVITLLSNILNKEVVQIEMPKTTRSDLDMIIKGELL